MHRRTALSVSAALLVAAPLLSACSGETRPGTAAVVGGERITTSALQAQVNDVRAAQNRSGQAAAELIARTPNLERAKLGKMIQLRVLEKAADGAGISVSTKEIEESREAQEKGAGGLEERALQGRVPLAPAQIDEELRFQLLLGKLTERFGEDKILQPLSQAAEQLDIEVNPRYGAWDARQIGLGAADTPWITQRTAPEQAPPAGA
ncbi:SurA N-terminal domain-containing protein [Streptomyces sp. NBC_01408]|uniref:SurA N-terminal domain-containing protein n=1 Tax=Streptomyces sp. NBC_01408 TaxID=2903855 RepID=UPI00225928C6|nr:SurA N-terminal domain-containing protein [Streptomyces sp. NBC_01408]MCX4692956.1 SurA N-terminal domain-containing protein [Streptomyces sp. NBC_01408]